jgi:flagellar assembly protein FliH
MDKEFNPYFKENIDKTFYQWDPKGEIQSTISKKTQEELLAEECEQIKQAAKQTGYEEGLAQAKQEVDEKVKELTVWVKLLEKPAKLIDEKLVQEMIQTLTFLCQHCIGIELSVNPEKLRELFKRIKDELPSLQGDKILAMNPEDFAWIGKNISEAEIPGLHGILVADANLNRGDFYLKSEHSELDGRIQSRLSSLFSKYISQDTVPSFNQQVDNDPA